MRTPCSRRPLGPSRGPAGKPGPVEPSPACPDGTAPHGALEAERRWSYCSIWSETVERRRGGLIRGRVNRKPFMLTETKQNSTTSPEMERFQAD